jgi:hypothetical protein
MSRMVGRDCRQDEGSALPFVSIFLIAFDIRSLIAVPPYSDILEVRAPRIGKPEEARWIRVKTNSLAASLFPALSRFLSRSQEEFEAKVEGPPLIRDISFDLPGSVDPVAITHAIVHYGANNSVSIHFQCIDAQCDHRTDASYRFAVSAASACNFEDAVESLSVTSLVNMPSADPFGSVSATPWPWALPILRRVKHSPPNVPTTGKAQDRPSREGRATEREAQA